MMIRMLLAGYIIGIRSERQLCEEVHLKLACRWFCQLDQTDGIPDHSAYSWKRHGRIRENNLFRQLFEDVLLRCIAEGCFGGGRSFVARTTNCLVDLDNAVIVDVDATAQILQRLLKLASCSSWEAVQLKSSPVGSQSIQCVFLRYRLSSPFDTPLFNLSFDC